ncbi:MAG: lysostaphin resistance A-like protein [Halobacteriaceae archaeon]
MDDHTRERLRAVGVAALVAVTGFTLGFVVLFVLGNVLYAAGVTLTGPVQLVLSLVALQGIGFPLTAFLYLRVRDLPLSYLDFEWPSLREVGVAVGGWLLILVFIYVAASVIIATGTETAQNQAGKTAMQNPEFIPYLIPLVFLLNAPGEEILFRGVIQNSLREHFGSAASILLAASMFAPAHVIALLGSWQAVAVSISLLFIPAVVFGAVFEYTDNLTVPSLCHALNNSFIFLLVYVSATAQNGSALFGL